MKLIFKPLNREQAIVILNWRYIYPYDRYNFDANTFKQDLSYLLDRQNAFFAILDLHEELQGYCSFGSDGRVLGGQYDTNALDIGMGVRPNLTGRGNGKQYARSVVEYGIRLYKAKQLRVTIAKFNQRAQRVWKQLGFEQVEKFTKVGTEDEFIIMIRAVSAFQIL